MNFTFNEEVKSSHKKQSSINVSLVQDVEKEEAIAPAPVVPTLEDKTETKKTQEIKQATLLKKQIITEKRIAPIAAPAKKALIVESSKSLKVNDQASTVQVEQARKQILRNKLIARYKKLKNSYNQDLELYLDKHRRFPLLARRFGHEGLVKYKVRIEKDGTFSKIIKVSSSGYETLDSESLSLLKQASGFKPLPSSLPFLTLNIPIEYKLH